MPYVPDAPGYFPWRRPRRQSEPTPSMYFLINTRYRVAFGWSAKCGCTMVKSLFFELSGVFMPNVHGAWLWAGLPPDGGGFEVIVFARNPYERLVSGFLDKYGRSRELEASDPLPEEGATSFSRFVRWLEQEGMRTRSPNFVHHFTPQLSEAWLDSMPVAKVYDIKAIDHEYLQARFESTIAPRERRMNAGAPVAGQRTGAGLLPISQLANLAVVPEYASFYDAETKAAVARIYRRDLEFFRRAGLAYDTEAAPSTSRIPA